MDYATLYATYHLLGEPETTIEPDLLRPGCGPMEVIVRILSNLVYFTYSQDLNNQPTNPLV